MAECFSDIPAFALSRSNHSADNPYYRGSETESCQDSQSGMTCKHSTELPGQAELMSSARDFHAKELAQLEPIARSMDLSSESTERAVSFGLTSQELLLSAGIQICLLKTPNICLVEDFPPSFKRLMPLGMSVNGVCWGLAISGPTMNESVCGSRLPTPTAHNSKEGAYPAEFTRNTPTLAAQIGGKINPDWNEWRMGWPIKWTDLKPLEMGKIQQWLRLHGKS